jgi:hypothetical protein
MFGHGHSTGAATIRLAASRRFEPEALAYTHNRSRLDDESLPHKQPPDAEAIEKPDYEASARFAAGPVLLSGPVLTVESPKPLSVFGILRSSQSRP